MKFKPVHIILLIIFLTGLFVRIYPSMSYNYPLKYDSYYHARFAELIKQTGTIPVYEPWPQDGRPHIYPPLYHISLASASFLTGIPVVEVVRFFLPFFSSLLILFVFWLASKFWDEKTSLIAAFFTAVNPYIISSSYDSPQMLGLLFVCVGIYLLFKKKYLLSGLMLAITFMFSSFAGAIACLGFVVFMVIDKDYKSIPKLFVLPVIIPSLWYLSRLNLLYCSDNFIGPHFIRLTLGDMLFQEALIICGTALTAFALINKITDRFQKFWVTWVVITLGLFLSLAITPALHPWRQGMFISFGFSFFIAKVLMDCARIKKYIFFFIFSFLFIAGSTMLFSLHTIVPGINDSERQTVTWIGQNIPSYSRVLANHDISANILTYTNNTCMLDISFECIEDKQRWFDLENFFWSGSSDEMQSAINKYSINYVVYGYFNWNNKDLEKLNVDKIYSSWSHSGIINKDSAVYKVRKYPIVRVDDIWAIENTSLKSHGYTYENLVSTLDVLKNYNNEVILGVTPFVYDEGCNCTQNLGEDMRIIYLLNQSINQGWKIALHGYTHYCLETECEFYGKSFEQDKAMISEAKDYLESLFNTNITIFIPPKNFIDANLSAALQTANLKLLTGNFYDPIRAWQWENNTITWSGFSDFGDDGILLHYNIMDKQKLNELEYFLSK